MIRQGDPSSIRLQRSDATTASFKLIFEQLPGVEGKYGADGPSLISLSILDVPKQLLKPLLKNDLNRTINKSVCSECSI